jgi:5-formyltetrahydrofolate cyclo-ligase
MFIPMLGFDRRGNRLGRGGGFYDRTLNEARHNRKVYAIGLAYACQEVPVIPCGPYEARLDAIVTDKEYIVLAKAN